MKTQAPRNKSTPDSGKLQPKPDQARSAQKEHGGRKNGLDPTRYGDWEKNGRCIDF
jgi:hypothetical protein